MTTVSVDVGELDNLAALISQAVERTPRERTTALTRTANKVRDEAAAIARSYPHGTGALASAVTVGGSDLTRIVGAEVREAFFLEYGSPSTGAPRPWLTGPARKGVDELLDELGNVGGLW